MAGLAEASGRVFVGRRRELGELSAGFDDAQGGRGRFFLVVGEPGIGKTRLVEEVAREAAERGAAVLWGRCWEGPGAPAYWPWTQVIRAVRAEVGARPDPFAVPADSEHARFHFFDAVATFIAAVAERTPVVVIVDDLQWADVPSLLLMQFVAQGPRESRLLLLGTYRDVEVRDSPAVTDALGALGRAARHVPLRGFGEDEVGCFIAETTGQRPSRALVRAVHQATEGNPFFVDETVRVLAAEGLLDVAANGLPARLPVPPGASEAIRRRLRPLPEPCRDVLGLAAVVGREFHVAVLERACGVDGQAVLTTLEPALARELVVPAGPGNGRYRFAHALIRETVYDDVPRADRARLHARIGDALEAHHRHDARPPLAALAHHFVEAATAGRADRAIAYGERAGRDAAASLGYEAAAEHFRTALDVLASARPADERGRCELLLALGEVQWKSADGPGARTTFGAAADLARRLGDVVLLARSALGFAGEGSRLFWTRSGVVDEPRVALLEEAIDRLGDREPALRARLLARLAINLYWETTPARALAVSDAAVTLARQGGDPRDLAAVLRARWVALWRPETTEERLAVADEIVRLGEQTSDRELVLLGRRFRIVGFLERADVAAADREIDAWAAIANELRLPLHDADVAMWRATRAIMDGRFDEGDALARRALELGEREPELEAAMRYRAQMSVLQLHRGTLEETAAARVHAGGGSISTLTRCHLAFFASETGRLDDARRELAALAADGFGFARDGGWLVCTCLLAAVAAEVEDAPAAARLHELLRPYAARLAIVAAGLACWGSVSHYLGLLAAALRRPDDARAHFEQAAAVHERIGARPFLAWTWFAHGRMLRTAEGATLVARALATAEDLGMDRLVAKIRDGPAPAGADAVFRHEGDFWTVAYAGKAVRVRHGKGLADIAVLLANPGRQIHVADLIAATSGAPPDARAGTAEGLGVSRGASVDVALDGRARADYRARLAELRRELDEAERCNDPGRTARTRAELDFIAGELASALGLGGRSRRAGSPVERARKAVASRIRFSVSHIAHVHPPLAEHLRRYIRTGTVCTYVVPDEPVRWRL